MKFFKYQALGNDYIIFDLITDLPTCKKVDDFIAYIRKSKVAQRNFSIGADGIIILYPGNKAPYRMVLINQDGSRAEICGNGLRCLSMYVYKHLTADHSTSIETDAGLSWSELISLNNSMGIIENSFPFISSDLPSYLPKMDSFPCSLTIDNTSYNFYLINVGNPHAILFVDRPEKFNLSAFYLNLCEEYNFFSKINLSIIKIDKNKVIHRIYERGVGETLSCGSASVAVFVVLKKLNKAEHNITLKHRGGELKVEKKNDNIYLIGEAYEVFTGDISIKKF